MTSEQQPEPGPTPPSNEGTSPQTSTGGSRKKTRDEILDAVMRSGDENLRKAAEETKRWREEQERKRNRLK
ncbi:MAG: hypothetical protein JSR77_18660 [Planctomycetes bacterium]|nr:hypothetical protein [Planctomycetota bacterium]